MDQQRYMLEARQLFEAGRVEDALARLDVVLAQDPHSLAALINRGNVLGALARPEDALASFDRALARDPAHAGALNNRGNTLRELGRPAEALASYDRALAAKPDFAAAWNGRGNALKDLDQLDASVASYDKALLYNPRYAEALSNRGIAQAAGGDYAGALVCYEHALALQPASADVWHNRGVSLRALGRFEEALDAATRAMALRPADANLVYSHGALLWQLNRYEDALASFDRTLALAPDHADAHCDRGTSLHELGRSAEAIAAFEAALRVAPRHRYAFGHLASVTLQTCDWARTAPIAAVIKSCVLDDKCIVPSLTFFGYCDEAAPQLACADVYMRDRLPKRSAPLHAGQPYRHGKIRLAYLSADFRRHATSVLMAELLERHDREQFEVIGISLAPDDGSALRARIVKAFDAFHDVNRYGTADVAALLRRLEVDIVVDLNGHTRGSYPEILAQRPAPVQVNFLGFPGTMAADFIDYVIADPVVLPMDQQPFYVEKIVQLPGCYQPNDAKRVIAPVPTRAEAGLPEEGFVFCCFNVPWKITPAAFDVWMRLLAAVPGSVLWLIEGNAAATDNLRAEAGARGIDPARLIFAPKLEFAEHLARHALADLFLDTLLYNAHTTASDALWAGLPIVALRGEAFPARVSASLLEAAGLPELVTDTLADYEALALKLARDPELLRSYRERLAQNRDSCALFDAPRFARNIEAAYRAMWERSQQGLPPQGFAVREDAQAGGRIVMAPGAGP